MSGESTRPSVSFLAPDERERIYQGALHVLGAVGMRVLHAEACELLAGGGCAVEQDQLVKIPAEVVAGALASAPRNISVYDRRGEPSMELGEQRCYFGTGSDLLFTLDPETGERRRSVIEDVRRAARVCNALPNIDFVMSLATPSDLPPRRSYLASFAALAANTTKPLVCTADDADDLAQIWEVAAAACGAERDLRARPYFIHYAEPASPLRHPVSSVAKLLLCADRRIPLVYSPAPIAGSTAPMTIAGHVVQGLAECLCGLVIHQIRAPGAPFLMGMGPAVLDMATIECSYSAPEYFMAYAVMIETIQQLGLPSWGYAGTSDSQRPDGQAVAESTIQTLLSGFLGANLNHDVGYLDFGRTGSLEQVVIQDELIGMLRRMLRGVPMDDEALALDVIAEAGRSGNFLGHKHTRRHVRSVQWRPKLFSRLGPEKWVEAGSQSLLDRACARLQTILREHAPEPLSDDVAAAIQQRVDAFS